MGGLTRKPVVLPLGFEMQPDGELVELSTRAYVGLTPEGVVRHALEEGVGARQTMLILDRMGVHDVKLQDVMDARAVIRAELAEEYAASKVEAKAMILRRADKAVSRLFDELGKGNTKVAKDIATLLSLQAKVYGLDKADDSMEAKLKQELSRVNEASRDSGEAIPRATVRHQEALEAALEKHGRHLFDDDGGGNDKPG